jgi:hypothetical protein
MAGDNGCRITDRTCSVTLQLKRGYKRKTICQEAASDVRCVEVTAELSKYYAGLLPVGKRSRS